MPQEALEITVDGGKRSVALYWVHSLVLGSGAAGLNAAIQLRRQGIDDVLIVTEGLDKGTSINAGSDKQTYYKLSLCGDNQDSPYTMAADYFAGGGMHGDIALVEAGLSTRAFMNLVNLGVPFPHDQFGQYAGYKTDHDPRQRATSVGPHTSRDMCRALIDEVKRLSISIHERRTAIKLLCLEQAGQKRACGIIALNTDNEFEIYAAENVVFAVGGPGGLYKSSVYPKGHNGAIGLALQEGAEAYNLCESQFGLASIKHRWNISGSYMQVIPRIISTAVDGISDEQEFLLEYFNTPAQMHNSIFLKGYQWPFDAEKVIDGSSLIDVLVYFETVEKGRRVFLDYRENAKEFDVSNLDNECRSYLQKSNALGDSPLQRLQQLNPQAIQLYEDHNIDLAREPLEIAVCAQHNNGGLAGTIWWESTNIKHLFPIGEVNGSHGIRRLGGAALNAGQVGGIRAAEYITHCCSEWTIQKDAVKENAIKETESCIAWLIKSEKASISWQQERNELQTRMSQYGAHIREETKLGLAVKDAWDQVQHIENDGCRYESDDEAKEVFQTRQLCFAQAVYLEAILFAVQSGVGSRGSALVLTDQGDIINQKLPSPMRMLSENKDFRENVLVSKITGPSNIQNHRQQCRPVPKQNLWFETIWKTCQSGEIYTDYPR